MDSYDQGSLAAIPGGIADNPSERSKERAKPFLCASAGFARTPASKKEGNSPCMRATVYEDIFILSLQNNCLLGLREFLALL
jgi:hypothetical protein